MLCWRIKGLFSLGLMASAAAASPPEMDGAYLKLGFDRLAGYAFVAPAADAVPKPGVPPSTGEVPKAEAPPPTGAVPKAEVSPPTGEDQIPAEVKGWNGRKAVVTGFMLPTKLIDGRAVECLIMANQMACCFGIIPNMNDWVVVRMAKGVPVIQDVPVSFYGVFRVGARFEEGFMTGIYVLDGERMAEVSK